MTLSDLEGHFNCSTDHTWRIESWYFRRPRVTFNGIVHTVVHEISTDSAFRGPSESAAWRSG